jgi:hypothetical protein|tara:strand:+ start:185 stop:472 length:288 start_codon:yes stop_codon:yes gene_type:complete
MSVPTVHINNIELAQHNVKNIVIENGPDVIEGSYEPFVTCTLRVDSDPDAWDRPVQSRFRLYFKSVAEAKHFFTDLNQVAYEAHDKICEGEANPR